MKITFPSQAKYALIGKETTWGTDVTADKDVGLIIKDVSNPITREVIESLGISSMKVQKITSGMVDVGVSMSGDFQHGRLLEYLFGGVAHAETTSDWKHTFTVSDTTVSATIETGNNLTTDTVLTSNGMIAETGELSIALNEVLQLSVDFKGKSTTSSDSAGTSVLSTLPVYPHALVNVSIDGTPASEVQSASVSINRVVERSGGVSSNLYQQGHAVEIKFEYSASLGFQDKTYQELFLGGTTPTADGDPTAYEFEINAHNGVTLGSGRRELMLVLENCISNSFTETTSVGGLTFIDISGVGTLKECFSVDNIADTSW